MSRLKWSLFNPLVLGVLLILIIITWFLWKKASREENYAIFKTYIFYLFGVTLTFFLIVEFPITTIITSFKKIGWGIIYVFSTAIPWFLFLGISLYTMLSRSIRYIKVCYIQFVGEGFSIMIPSGGIAGEIIKIQRCKEETTIDIASISVIFDRLAHVNSSTIMAASTAHLSLVLIPMDAQMKQIMVIISIVFYVISIAFIAVAFSRILEKMIITALKRLKLSEDITVTIHIAQRKKFIISLFYRTLGRVVAVIEYYVILLLLDIPPTSTILLGILTGISISASTFFIVPQGLGVNEAGVAGAFSVLGMDPAIGVVIALTRRARIVFWALCGVSAYSLELFFAKIKPKVDLIKKSCRK